MDELSKLALEALDVGLVLTDKSSLEICLINAAAHGILKLFGGRGEHLPPVLRRAARDAVLELELGNRDAFSPARRLATPGGTVVYARAKIISDQKLIVMITLAVGRLRQRDLCTIVHKRYGLSSRETEVLLLLRHGLDNAAIAGQLGIGVATVKTYVSNLLATLGVKNRIQLMSKLERLGPEVNSDPEGSFQP